MNLSEQISRIKQVMNLNEDVNLLKMKSALFAYFDFYTKDANVYFNPENESTWMIFPEEKKWVFELHKSGILWFNFYFFENIFSSNLPLNIDYGQTQHYIGLWVENMLKRKVERTTYQKSMNDTFIKNALENGIIINP